MRLLIFILAVLYSATLLASFKIERPWIVKCGPEKCFMQVIVPYKHGDKMEQAGLSVSYQLKATKPHVIGFYLPADVDAKAGLIINFIDTIPDGNSFKLEPAEGTMARLPINNCNSSYCSSLIYKDLKSFRNKDMDLINELMIREHVWLLFKRKGEKESLMIPTYKFRDEVKKLPKK